MEYVGPKYRTLVANLSLLLFYTPFTMLMPWIALASGTWRTFAIMASLPLGSRCSPTASCPSLHGGYALSRDGNH